MDNPIFILSAVTLDPCMLLLLSLIFIDLPVPLFYLEISSMSTLVCLPLAIKRELIHPLTTTPPPPPTASSLSNMAFCAGASNNCFATVSIIETMSVADELGTSGPWEDFMRNGGVLLLALFGTLCVW